MANLNALLARGVKDLLTEKSYDAAMAELLYNVSAHFYGMYVLVTGYDDKLPVLLRMVIEKITNFALTEERFAVLKDYHLRKLKNWADDQPYTHSALYTTHVLQDNHFLPMELLAAGEGSFIIYTFWDFEIIQ